MITLYSMPSSGNSYKVRLLLAQLGIPFQHIAAEYDGEKRLTMTSKFLAKNPAGKVPLIEFEDGQLLSESNAILLHFAENTHFLPTDKLQRARAWQWMFFEQNTHEASVAVRMATFNYPDREMDRSPARMQSLLDSGHAALDVMEAGLAKSDFLAGSQYSVADISLYAYTHGAEKGGFDLGKRPLVTAWLKKVKSQSGHVPIEWLPIS